MRDKFKIDTISIAYPRKHIQALVNSHFIANNQITFFENYHRQTDAQHLISHALSRRKLFSANHNSRKKQMDLHKSQNSQHLIVLPANSYWMSFTPLCRYSLRIEHVQFWKPRNRIPNCFEINAFAVIYRQQFFGFWFSAGVGIFSCRKNHALYCVCRVLFGVGVHLIVTLVHRTMFTARVCVCVSFLAAERKKLNKPMNIISH